MQTTRWVDHQTKSIDEAIRLIESPKADDKSYTNFTVMKTFDRNPTIDLNGQNIVYNFITYSYDYILSLGEDGTIEESTKKDGFVIIYYNGTRISYIISRNTGALTLLRKLLGYSGHKEIEKINLPINSDLFVWLIKKVYTHDNILENEESSDNNLQSLTIDAIKGFKGDSDDLLTQVSTNGESVMNIISTLSFLLESRNLNQIKLDLECPKHKNLELTLAARGTVSIQDDQYIGDFDNKSREVRISKLHLLVYIEVLPLIIQTIQKEAEDDLWNSQKYIDFLTDVATDLSKRVERKIEILNS